MSTRKTTLLGPDDSDKIRLGEETIFTAVVSGDGTKRRGATVLMAAPVEQCSSGLSHNTRSRICDGGILHYRLLQITKINVELFNELLSVFIREPFPCPLEVLELA